jgi:hypothetical protein
MLPEYRWRVGRVHGTCVVETVDANERTYGLQPMQGVQSMESGLEWQRVNVEKRMDAR